MQHNAWFFMSLSGSIVFLLYLMLYPILSKYTSVKCRYMVLKAALVFYLFPLANLFYWTKSLFYHFHLIEIEETIETKIFDYLSPIIIGSTVRIPANVMVALIIISFSGLFSLTILVLQLLHYQKAKKRHLGCGVTIASPAQRSYFLKVQNQVGLKKKVVLMFSMYEQVPMTIGVFSPVVLLPSLEQEQMVTEDWDYILRHEFIHIKNRDLLFKFIGLIVMIVNWFNPLCYFLFREICTLGEMACDAEVIDGRTDEHRQKYSHLIIEMAAENQNNSYDKKFLSMGLLCNDSSVMKRRILEMKRKKTVRRGFSFIIGLAICILAAMPVFAYSPPLVIKTTGPNMTKLTSDSEIQFILNFQADEDEGSTYDMYFVDEHGNTYEYKGNQSKVLCTHSMKSGTIAEHTRFSDGSCEKVYHYAEKCVLCEYIVKGDYCNTISYKKCTH